MKSKSATKYLEQLIIFKVSVVEAVGAKSVAFECKNEELHLIEQSIKSCFHTNAWRAKRENNTKLLFYTTKPIF